MSVLTKERVREIFMAHGFMIKEGQTDLKAYVYAAADALVDAALAADRAARAEPVGWYFADDPKVYTLPGGGFRLGKEKPEDTLFAVPLYTAPPAAPVATTEEGRHCGDPDCVPCRDPAEPAAPIVPECPFPCGWRKLYELMMRDAAWVSSQLQAYPDEPLPEHLPQIVFVNHDRALRVVRAMLAAHEAKRVSCSQIAKTSTREGGRVNETEKSEQIAEAVKAERERIYALIDTNPEHIWRDAGFMQWRAKRSQESE